MALTKDEIADEIKWIEKHHIECGNGGNGGWLPIPPCDPLDFEPLKKTAMELLEVGLEQEDILPSDAQKVMDALAEKYQLNYPSTAMGAYNLLNLYALPTNEKIKLINALANDVREQTPLLTTAIV